MIGDLFYQLGLAFGRLEGMAGTAGAGAGAGSGAGADGPPDRGREAAVYDPETGDVFDLEEDPLETAQDAVQGLLIAWLASRVLRPKPVSWPRVFITGIAATTLADLVGRYMEEESPADPPYAADPRELLARMGAGVAVAAGYASIVYPRVPGSPMFRGLLFGALEIAAAPRGGLVRVAAETPGVRFPLQALALPVDEDAGPISHLAYGVGLGMFYR